jgi:hypothetical protein
MTTDGYLKTLPAVVNSRIIANSLIEKRITSLYSPLLVQL